nr:transglutaminaseTgpA domain-containing protein [Streptomyces reniochalinae]
MRHRLSPARRAWSLLPVAGMLVCAGLGFHRVFAVGALMPVLAVAVPVPMVVAAGLYAGQRRKGRVAPLWPSLVLNVVVWLVVVCATLFRGDASAGLPTGEAGATVWAALLDSPHAVLTTILPAPSGADFLVLPHAVVWLASLAATELALRTRGPLLPALPPVLAFGFPLVLGVAGPGSNTPVAAGLVACAAVLVLLRSRAAGRGTVRMLSTGLPVVAVLALAAALLGPRLPGLSGRDPYDLRQEVRTPTVHPRSTSPLDQVAAWSQHPESRLFTARTTADRNWRLAVLDRYDGVKWTSGAHLARSGGRVPERRGPDPGRRERVEQRVTVQNLPGIWLPAADRPSSVTLTGISGERGAHGAGAGRLAVDPDSGVVAVGEGGATGTRSNRGLSYTAVSQAPVYDPERLRYAAVPKGTGYKSLPRTDQAGEPVEAVETFRRLAATATAGSSYPYQQAYKLAGWLHEHYGFDPKALPGHAYRNLEFFLTTGKHGTSEQFAASFAVMGRTLGLPTRVAVGFRAERDERPGAGGKGTRQVTGQDALAWPEVRFEGVGWVPFYPTPGQASEEGASVPPAGQPEEREEADRDIAERPRPSVPPQQPEDSGGKDGRAAPSGGGGLPVWAYVLPSVLLLVLAYGGYAVWAPYRARRRRRGARDPGQRVLGAWQQIVDRLTEIGLPATSAHTATEVAAFGLERVGGRGSEQLPALARLVNEVDYGGRVPDEAAADAAWRHCDAIEEVVTRTVPRRERVKRALRWGTVRRHSRARAPVRASRAEGPVRTGGPGTPVRTGGSGAPVRSDRPGVRR